LVIDDRVPAFGADHRGHSVFFDVDEMPAGALDDVISEETIVRFEVFTTVRALDDKFSHILFLLSPISFLQNLR
jgi:hypothetical protein